MRLFIMPLLAALFTLAAPAMAARDILSPADIEAMDTSQAVLTVSAPGNPARIQAIRFPIVPDLQACFSLAYSAVAQTRGESSATCINERGVISATYFCAWGGESPECRMVAP